MKKRKVNRGFFCLALCMALLLAMFFPTAKGTISSPPGPYHYVIATIGEPETVDPALAYDTASGELIMQVYETLIEFKGSTTYEFVPELATEWNISSDGQTYTFQIRTNVQFHDGSTLMPEDVEYSLERVMVRDYSGGPAWMFYEPIFGTHGANITDPVLMGQKIDDAIESNATHVVIQFVTGHAYAPFLSILAQSMGSILSKAWATAHGDWPGTGLRDGSWVAYHKPYYSPLDGSYFSRAPIMMGTGPYKFDYWRGGVEWSIVKFDNYWGGWGNPRRGFASRGYLTRITVKQVSDWSSRLAGFMGTTSIYDSIYVPKAEWAMLEVWQKPGIRCRYPLTSVAVDALFFNYNTTRLSPYIGDGVNPNFTFGETGIRPDFFSDVHVRKAMAYSFNWTYYISSAYMGEAKQNAIPVPDTFKFFDPALPKYGIDLTLAAEEWKQAWGGEVWNKGFYFEFVFSIGGWWSKSVLYNLFKTALLSLNPKFHIDIVGLSGETYFNHIWYPPAGNRAIVPTFRIGWLAEYPDEHNFAVPFMASWGDFAYLQSIYMDPYSLEMDNLSTWGLHNTTDAGRKANYDRLWQLYIQQVPSVPLIQGIGRRWERQWVQGWYYNPAFPGTNFYPMWKEELPWEDINTDGKVDIQDLATAAKAYGACYIQPLLRPYPKGPPGYYTTNWDSRADINQDMKVDIIDLAKIAKLFGSVAPPWTPP